MDIVTDGGDADAHLDLPPASPASIAGEFVTDRFALYDHAIMANAAAWKRINAALLGAATAPGRGQAASSSEKGQTRSQPRAAPDDRVLRSTLLISLRNHTAATSHVRRPD